MYDLLGRGVAPTAADTVITVGSGITWKYVLSGLPNLWVQGGINFGDDEYTFWFDNIQTVHDEISKHVLSRGTFSSAEFRFLRKEIGITVEEFSLHTGLDAEAITQWEMGRGFVVDKADKRIRELYAMWKDGVFSPKSRARQDRQATV